MDINWKKIVERKWLGFSLFFLLLVVIVICNYLIPRINRILKTQQIISQKKEQITLADNWQQRLSHLRSYQNELKDKLSNIYVDVPKSDRISIVMDLLNKSAEGATIQFNRINPKSYIEKDQHIEVPIELVIKGYYHGVAKFINQLEESNYIIRVNRTNLFKKGLNEQRLVAKINFNLIILKEDIFAAE